MTDIDKAEFFERAADVIRTYGHHKGSLWKNGDDDSTLYWRIEDGMPEGWNQAPVCAWGAMYVAGGQMLDSMDPEKTPKINKLGELLDARVPHEEIWMGIADWNDAEDTTVDEVVDKMLELAKDLRNGEVK